MTRLVAATSLAPGTSTLPLGCSSWSGSSWGAPSGAVSSHQRCIQVGDRVGPAALFQAEQRGGVFVEDSLGGARLDPGVVDVIDCADESVAALIRKVCPEK